MEAYNLSKKGIGCPVGLLQVEEINGDSHRQIFDYMIY